MLVTAVVGASLVASSGSGSVASGSSLLAPTLAGVSTEPSALFLDERHSGEAAPIGLPAEVEDATNVTSRVAVFPSTDAVGTPVAQTQWRIIDGTGNCCENYLAASDRGTLFDFGGDYIYFSTDQGATWKRVVPSDPLPNFGEGTITMAPNGDIVGVAWNPYYGDRVQPFKYDAASEGWFYTHTKLHQPFFDRESVAVVPGPFEFAGQNFPYLSILRGGAPLKSPWLYSFDGLNYFVPNAKFFDLLTHASDDPLEIKPDPAMDWIQPAEQTGLTPFGDGRALAMNVDWFVGGFETQFAKLNRSNLRWAPFQFPGGPLPQNGRLRVDSKGRLHYVAQMDKGFRYLLSLDGGATWNEQVFDLPSGFEVFDYAFAVNGGLDMSAVAINGRNENAKTNQDFVYRFGLKKNTPKLKRIDLVGDGKGNYGAGVLAEGARFDFATIVILPDGRVATSFASTEPARPQLAVEIGPVATP